MALTTDLNKDSELLARMFQSVDTFNAAIGHKDTIDIRTTAQQEVIDLRKDLISEERQEIAEAENAEDVVGFVDGICDLNVVTMGAVSSIRQYNADSFLDTLDNFSLDNSYSLDDCVLQSSRENFLTSAAIAADKFLEMNRHSSRLNLENNFFEVMRSNMSKFAPDFIVAQETVVWYEQNKGFTPTIKECYSFESEFIGYGLYRHDGKMLKAMCFSPPEIKIGK